VCSQSSHPAITLPAAAAQAQRCCAVPVRPYPCTAIHWHRRTGQRQLTAPGTGRRLLPCHTSARQLRNDSSHHQALAVARRQRQLSTRTTGTGPSGVGTRHSAPAIDLLRPSTFHFAPPVVDLLHLGATSSAKNTIEPSTLCSVVQPLCLCSSPG
jgi:hypothetical protein